MFPDEHTVFNHLRQRTLDLIDETRQWVGCGLLDENVIKFPGNNDPLTFTNKSDGLESRVVKTQKGWKVTFHDTDADEQLPIIKVFPDRNKAVKMAKSFVSGKPMREMEDYDADHHDKMGRKKKKVEVSEARNTLRFVQEKNK